MILIVFVEDLWHVLSLDLESVEFGRECEGLDEKKGSAKGKILLFALLKSFLTAALEKFLVLYKCHESPFDLLVIAFAVAVTMTQRLHHGANLF